MSTATAAACFCVGRASRRVQQRRRQQATVHGSRARQRQQPPLACHGSLPSSVAAWPTSHSERRARVRATFMRRTSDRKPTPPPLPAGRALQGGAGALGGGGKKAGVFTSKGRALQGGGSCAWAWGDWRLHPSCSDATSGPQQGGAETAGRPHAGFAQLPQSLDEGTPPAAPASGQLPHRTHEKITTSASRPWKPSTVPNCTPAAAAAGPPRAAKTRRSSASWARYGVSTATSPRSPWYRAARPAGVAEAQPCGRRWGVG
jgi:hypothetical protein